jgi:hypothetical protein
MDRTAHIHDATAQKHDSVEGPLFVVAVYEGRRIIDTHEGESASECAQWARSEYGLVAQVSP